jgi:hypothetical protein
MEKRWYSVKVWYSAFAVIMDDYIAGRLAPQECLARLVSLRYKLAGKIEQGDT